MHLNNFSLWMQDETSVICELHSKVKVFSQKLTLFEIQLLRSCFIHFSRCEIYSQKAVTPFPCSFAQDIIWSFKQKQLLERLSYLDACSSKIRLLENPFHSVGLIENLPSYGSYRFTIHWHPQLRTNSRKEIWSNLANAFHMQIYMFI